MQLILASTSPARISLLQAAGVIVTPVGPDVDESAIQAPDPVTLAARRAAAKAAAVAERYPDAWVIGADQVAWLGDDVFGKPRNVEDHRRRLLSLRGQTHTLTTAVDVRRGSTVRAWQTHTRLKVRADLSEEEVYAYVASGEGSACAGGYAAEGHGSQLLAAIDGDWFNVLGLPVLELVTVLRELGWRPSFGASTTVAPADPPSPSLRRPFP